ncbi:hypothetical protein GYA93_10730 [Gordonia desulfuricans]|uniref:Uncharacterized protein n=1 Tax=Gordonia desulfuricans TaxID=89051 RepID=A0A7K3LP78_9ACTN|nr:hypothetical protein [Gordonia desulfuricans]NDK90052.1 hypothetical protein [Gordonia desulfuricans]
MVALMCGLVSACASEPATLEERLVAKCIETVQDNIEVLSFGRTVISTDFSNMSAHAWDESRATERWLVSGGLTLKTQSTSTVAADTWDDDGAAPTPEMDLGELTCRMGHRKSDGALVVFEFSQAHPTSGGSIGKQLVFEEGAEGETSKWG